MTAAAAKSKRSCFTHLWPDMCCSAALCSASLQLSLSSVVALLFAGNICSHEADDETAAVSLSNVDKHVLMMVAGNETASSIFGAK